MTFPCCGCALKVGCRIFGSVDIFLSIMSFFQWLNMFMEASRFRGSNWEPFLNFPRSQIMAVQLNCVPRYFEMYTPEDLGMQLTKTTVFFSLSAVGYLVAGLFVIYATISAPDTGKILLSVFAFCQLILSGMSISASVMFQSPSLCFYQFDGQPGHKSRQLAFLVLTFLFVFGYKLYEFVVVFLYRKELGRVVPHDDPELGKMSPAKLRALQLITPKGSKANSLDLDINMNYPEAQTEESPKPDVVVVTDQGANVHVSVIVDQNQNLDNSKVVGAVSPKGSYNNGFYSPNLINNPTDY